MKIVHFLAFAAFAFGSAAQDSRQFQAQLRSLDIDAGAVTYTTNQAGRISFTIRCANEAERARVRDGLMRLTAGGVKSTKEPPTVSGVVPQTAVAAEATDEPGKGSSERVAGEGFSRDESISRAKSSSGVKSSPSSGGTVRSSASSKSDEGKTVHVDGYTRKDGTHVNSYNRRPPGSKH